MFGTDETGVESAVASMPAFSPTQTHTHKERHKQTHTDTHSHTHTHAEKKEKQREKRKSCKAETITRLSPRSKRYYFSHSRASRIQCSMAALFWRLRAPSFVSQSIVFQLQNSWYPSRSKNVMKHVQNK